MVCDHELVEWSVIMSLVEWSVIMSLSNGRDTGNRTQSTRTRSVCTTGILCPVIDLTSGIVTKDKPACQHEREFVLEFIISLFFC